MDNQIDSLKHIWTQENKRPGELETASTVACHIDAMALDHDSAARADTTVARCACNAVMKHHAMVPRIS